MAAMRSGVGGVEADERDVGSEPSSGVDVVCEGED
jgi:hypothetical protein